MYKRNSTSIAPSGQGEETPISLDNFRMAVHEEMNRAMRMMIVPKQPIDSSVFVDEFRSTVASPLSFQLQADRPVLVRTILYSYSPVAAATLAIGDRIIALPVVTGTALIPNSLNVEMVVYPKDVITLTCVGATSMFLEVMGNPLTGTDWSVI